MGRKVEVGLVGGEEAQGTWRFLWDPSSGREAYTGVGKEERKGGRKEGEIFHPCMGVEMNRIQAGFMVVCLLLCLSFFSDFNRN